jgi:chromosome segregation ATPase
MDSIRDNIQEYEKSAASLNTRIRELNTKLAHAGEAEAATLNERRYALYKMMWEVQQDIRELREYIRDGDCDDDTPLVEAVIPRGACACGNEISVGKMAVFLV